MPVLAIFAPLVSFLLRQVVVKFVVFASLFAVVTLLVPYAVSYLSHFISPSALTSAFSVLPPGIWFFLDFFRLDFGAPLMISAFVYRFMIRRLPVIG